MARAATPDSFQDLKHSSREASRGCFRIRTWEEKSKCLGRSLGAAPWALFSYFTVFIIGAVIALTPLHGTQATVSFNSQINFQGRLTDANGNVVADGTYNVDFKLYNHATNGTQAQGTCSANCIWEETKTVSVSRGLFSTQLGSTTALPSASTFNQDLYLALRIGGTGTPNWAEPEMTPRMRMGAAPTAIFAGLADNSNQLGGVAAASYVQSSSLTLQNAYNTTSGNTISTTSARDLSVTLADSATDANFLVNIATGSTSKFAIQNAGTDVFSYDTTNGLVVTTSTTLNGVELIKSTGTSPFKVTKTDGTGNSFIVDTTNTRIGIGIAPQYTIHASGTASASMYGELRNNKSDGTGVAGWLLGNNSGEGQGGLTLGGSAYSSYGGASSLNLINGTASGVIALATNNTVQATLDAGGRFGLGLVPASSGSLLQVAGAIQPKITSSAAWSSALEGSLVYDDTTNKFYLYDSGAKKELCNMSDLGCGAGGATTLQSAYNATSGNSITTTDGRDLTVTLDNTTTDPNFLVNIAASSTGKFAIQAAGTDFFTATSSGLTVTKDTYLNLNSGTAFKVEQDGVKDDVFVVDTTNGRVGIGVASPGRLLDIQNAAGQAVLNIKTGSSSSFAQLNLSNDTTDALGQIFVNGSAASSYGGNNSLNIYNAANAAITFATNNTERLRIAGDGSTTLKTDSATAFRIQNAAGTTTLFTADANGSTLTLGVATTASSTLTVSGQFRAGDGTNNTTVDGTSKEISFAGTAQHARTVTLVPEYPGATFTGDGSSNNGSLTSDFCSGSSRMNINASICGATETFNYYTWTTTQGTAQDYDLFVRYQVPSDYGSTPAFSMSAWRTTSSDTVQLSIVKDDGTSCAANVDTATGTAAWTTTNVSNSCSFSPDDLITFRVHVTAVSGEYARASKIQFTYKSRW